MNIFGYSNMLNLSNLQGGLLMSIKTKSGYRPDDIAVTKSGDLVYTHNENRIVNIVNNAQTKAVIRLRVGYLWVSVVPSLMTSWLSCSAMILIINQKLYVTLAPQRNKVYSTMPMDKLSIHQVFVRNSSQRTGT